MHVAASLMCPHCNWKGLVASPANQPEKARERQQALLGRHIQKDHGLDANEVDRILRLLQPLSA